jgi:spermidine synthase
LTDAASQSDVKKTGGGAGAMRPRPAVETYDGELRLLVDGAVQSVAVGATTPRGYWPALLPEQEPKSALILGLGGGTVAHLLRRRWRDVSITGVDDDAEVLRLARSRFGLDTLNVEIVEADARVYTRRCARFFDLVVVDVYRGEVAAEFLNSGAFIRSVRQLVNPGGTAVWNLHRDRRGALLRRRAGRGMVLDRGVITGLNLVLHFRRTRRVLHLSLPAR